MRHYICVKQSGIVEDLTDSHFNVLSKVQVCPIWLMSMIMRKINTEKRHMNQLNLNHFWITSELLWHIESKKNVNKDNVSKPIKYARCYCPSTTDHINPKVHPILQLRSTATTLNSRQQAEGWLAYACLSWRLYSQHNDTQATKHWVQSRASAQNYSFIK